MIRQIRMMTEPLIYPGPNWIIPRIIRPTRTKKSTTRRKDTKRAVLKVLTLELPVRFREPYSSNFDSKRATMASRASCSSSPSTDMRSSVL